MSANFVLTFCSSCIRIGNEEIKEKNPQRSGGSGHLWNPMAVNPAKLRKQ